MFATFSFFSHLKLSFTYCIQTGLGKNQHTGNTDAPNFSYHILMQIKMFLNNSKPSDSVFPLFIQTCYAKINGWSGATKENVVLEPKLWLLLLVWILERPSHFCSRFSLDSPPCPWLMDKPLLWTVLSSVFGSCELTSIILCLVPENVS